MKLWLKRIGILLLIVATVYFWGRWFLDLFGVIKYKPPLSQDIQNIVQVDLLDTSDKEWVVLYSIMGEELNQFVDDYMQIDFGRHANDPPVWYGYRTIRICYADGGYDLHGEIVDFFSSSGQSLPTRGWYYITDDDIDAIFQKYID